MKSMQELTCDGLEALRTLLVASPEGAGHTVLDVPSAESLRLLAFLTPLMHRALAETAASLGSSPIKAAAFAMLAEELEHLAGYGQILAAGKIEDTGVHTLTAEPLAELRETLADPAGFVAGTTTLPAGHCSKPGTKHLYKDPAQYLKGQLRLTFFQAQQRLAAANHLVAHTGFNNKQVPPRYPELARLLKEGAADPHLLASTAQRLDNLRPALEHRYGPAAVNDAETKLADALHTRDTAGINVLLKAMTVALDSSVIDDEEAVHQANFGMRFRGKRTQGYLWEITTGVEGHEMLSTLADQLNNPRKPANANRTGSAAVSSTDVQTPEGGNEKTPLQTIQPPEAPRIPDWAIAPDTPPELRPVAGFTDLGQPVQPAGIHPDMLPGETPQQAKARSRERRLLQTVFDAIRYMGGAEPGASGPEAGLPMKPNLDIMITLSWDSLVGRLDEPGISSHGHLISAATVRALACKANLIPAVMGTQGRPLDLGRTQRFFNRAQRRALTVRDRGCINPGCSMPAHRCEANHIKPWFLGGKTNVDNACLLCTSCHAAFHAGHFRIIVSGGIPFVVASKANDPDQMPRRNWIWHPESEVA